MKSFSLEGKPVGSSRQEGQMRLSIVFWKSYASVNSSGSWVFPLCKPEAAYNRVSVVKRFLKSGCYLRAQEK